jgi:ribosomal protein L11 methylase PrmA
MGKFLKGKRVLDLGCGSGAATLAALKAGANKPVYANDIDQVRKSTDKFLKVQRIFGLLR